MSRGLKDERHGIDIPQIQTRIAAIQDTTYPDAENLAPHDQLDVRIRDEGYRRHNFSGLNVFLLEMFNQFDDVLGVRKTDFMTGSKEDIGHAVDDMVRTARDDVADARGGGRLAGPEPADGPRGRPEQGGPPLPERRRVPPGVPGTGGRRAAEAEAGRSGSSGRPAAPNELGVLVGADGKPLPTEFFARDPTTGKQRFQPHHEVITSPDQVQVYETLLRDAKGEFTTSFVRGCETVKDNRLLPRGWKTRGPRPGADRPVPPGDAPRPGRRRRPAVRRRQRVRRGDLPHRAAGGRRPGPAPGPGDAVLPGHAAVLPAEPVRDGPRRPGDPPAALPCSATWT